MSWDHVDLWISRAPLSFLALVPILMGGAVIAGVTLRRRRNPQATDEPSSEDLEGIMVSAVLGLLALLMGFTFSIALSRFEDRRDLVLQEANAIGTAYLRAQLLEEPHRARLSRVLVAYTDNRLVLAKASPGHTSQLLAMNDAMLLDLWAATVAAVPTVRDPGVSGQFVASVNAVIDLDSARKAARVVHVPGEVVSVIFASLIVVSAMLGFLAVGRRGKLAVATMVGLLALVLVLILDIDRPTGGGIREGQAPMEQLLASLKAQPPAAFDRYRREGAAAPAP